MDGRQRVVYNMDPCGDQGPVSFYSPAQGRMMAALDDKSAMQGN